VEFVDGIQIVAKRWLSPSINESPGSQLTEKNMMMFINDITPD